MPTLPGSPLPAPGAPGQPGMPSADGQGDAGTPAGGMPSPGQGDALPGLDPSARDGGESGTNPAGGDSGAMPGSPAGGFDPAGGGAGTSPGGPGGGDYTLDTLPGGGVFQGSAGAAGQPGGDGGGMTAAQRAAVLDGQLRRTYEIHDEVLRREQAEARGVGMPGGGNNGGPPPGGGGEGGAQQSGGPDGAGSPNGPGGPEFDGPPMPPSPSSGGRQGQPTYPPPDDIPSGRDDDVVARQLREAAMTEPDPELREALWDEYRNYTGIATDG